MDSKFLIRLNQQIRQNPHFKSGAECFIVTHYAGEVIFYLIFRPFFLGNLSN